MIISEGKKDSTSKIKISVISNCNFPHYALGNILSGIEDMHLLDKIGSIDSISSLSVKPEIVIMCYACLNIKDINKIIIRLPNIKILVCNADSKDERKIIALIKSGVKGIIHNEDNCSILSNAIRKIYKGEHWIKRSVMKKVLKEFNREIELEAHITRLTELFTYREKEILHLITKGNNNSAIAGKLLISEKTVKSHTQKIFKKLNCNNKVEATVLASEFVSREFRK